ncbi:MAG: hypothetical protein ACI8V7_000492 [Candidatus Paceibacteria bacterium]|jgi:hypothetical protein
MHLPSTCEYTGYATTDEAEKKLGNKSPQDIRLFIENLEKIIKTSEEKTESTSSSWQTTDSNMADYCDNEVGAEWRGHAVLVKEVKTLKNLANKF